MLFSRFRFHRRVQFVVLKIKGNLVIATASHGFNASSLRSNSSGPPLEILGARHSRCYRGRFKIYRSRQGPFLKQEDVTSLWCCSCARLERLRISIVARGVVLQSCFMHVAGHTLSPVTILHLVPFSKSTPPPLGVCDSLSPHPHILRSPERLPASLRATSAHTLLTFRCT